MHLTGPSLDKFITQLRLTSSEKVSTTKVEQALAQKGHTADPGEISKFLEAAEVATQRGRTALRSMGDEVLLRPSPKTRDLSPGGGSAFQLMSKTLEERRSVSPRKSSLDMLEKSGPKPSKMEAVGEIEKPKGPSAELLVKNVTGAMFKAEDGYVAGKMMYAEDNLAKEKFSFRERQNGMAPDNKSLFMKLTPASGKTASQALDGIFGGPTVCECHSLMQAVFFEGIRQSVGDATFNEKFAKMSVEPQVMSKANVLDKVTTKLPLSGEADIQAGDWVYAANHFDYKEKHPMGAAGGWNLLCVGENEGKEKLYLGFGLTPVGAEKVVPMTLNQILQKLESDYAEPSVKDSSSSLERLDVDAGRMAAFGGKHEKAELALEKGIKRLDPGKLAALLAG